MSTPEREFEIVADSERGDGRGAAKSPAFLALLAGKTIRIPLTAGIGNWSRQARAHGMRIRTHKTAEGRVVWFEPVPGDREGLRLARLWDVTEEAQEMASEDVAVPA